MIAPLRHNIDSPNIQIEDGAVGISISSLGIEHRKPSTCQSELAISKTSTSASDVTRSQFESCKSW